jgi:hypothetical protein
MLRPGETAFGDFGDHPGPAEAATPLITVDRDKVGFDEATDGSPPPLGVNDGGGIDVGRARKLDGLDLYGPHDGGKDAPVALQQIVRSGRLSGAERLQTDKVTVVIMPTDLGLGVGADALGLIDELA